MPQLALQELGGCHDRNGLKSAEAQQITVTGNDYFGLGFKRALKNSIIIRIHGCFDMNLGIRLA